MNVTVEEVITKLSERFIVTEHSVDGLVSGDRHALVAGIAVMFTASVEAIRQATTLGANFIVSHEPVFYHHTDDTARLGDDPVYKAKAELIASSGIHIYRHHDAMHQANPDDILSGMLQELEWKDYLIGLPKLPGILELPEQSAGQLAEYIKHKLNIPYVRLVGDSMMMCSKVGLALGYSGRGEKAIRAYREHGLDLIIAGESPEWETPEYVRDANALGQAKAMLIMGHQKSEEAGMRSVQDKLSSAFPGIGVHYVETAVAIGKVL